MDPYVELASLAIHHFIHHGRPPTEIPPGVREALRSQRAATFVSLHTRSGELRGCKGTLEPGHASVVEEVIHNAISACSRDPRFPLLRAEELDGLAIHVDVLSPLETIRDTSELDVRRYGILVSAPDGRRGVLLPDLESIDTVKAQVDLACRKARIDPAQEAFLLQRFTTSRHP